MGSGYPLESDRRRPPRLRIEKHKEDPLLRFRLFVREPDGTRSGAVRGKRETLKRLLNAKFGPLPKETEARIDAVQSGENLDQYVDRVLVAESLEDIGLEQ